MELIKLFDERSLFDFSETEALSAIRDLLGKASGYENDNYIAVFEWIMDKWKLSPEKIDRYCIEKTQRSAYGLLLMEVCNMPRSYYKKSKEVVKMLKKHGLKPRASELASVKFSSYEKKNLPEYCAWIEELRRENP